MTDVMETADALHASANRLYWHSRDSVETLAARLGMSPHALYASVQPAPAEAACAACGEGLVFANRARRANGQADCPGCGAAQQVEASGRDELPPAPLSARPRGPRAEALRRWWRDVHAVPRERFAMIGGAAALGLAAALVAGEVIRDAGRF
jgi:hypothetical protein